MTALTLAFVMPLHNHSEAHACQQEPHRGMSEQAWYLGHKLVVAQHVVGILEGLCQQHLALLLIVLFQQNHG